MNYATQAGDPARNALMNMGMKQSPQGDAMAVSTKPRLQQQLDQLEKVLACCHEVAGGIDGCADKLMGAEPKDATGVPPTPSPMSVEGRLANAIGYAEHLMHRLNETGRRLNQAV